MGSDTRITSGKDVDQITLVNSGLTGGLTIDAGDGGNVVKLETVTVGGATRITTGKDADQITLVNSGLTGGLTIDAGDGGNVVKLETVTVGGDTRITTGRTRIRSRWSTRPDRRPDDRRRRRRQCRRAGDGYGGRRYVHRHRQGCRPDHADADRRPGHAEDRRGRRRQPRAAVRDRPAWRDDDPDRQRPGSHQPVDGGLPGPFARRIRRRQ